ncbi:MAG: hypothetical protein U9Q07_14570, partial [Planctomycetota bacterium]|nr:hypothetical protein [Planctomycetota bacterium]
MDGYHASHFTSTTSILDLNVSTLSVTDKFTAINDTVWIGDSANSDFPTGTGGRLMLVPDKRVFFAGYAWGDEWDSLNYHNFGFGNTI